MCGIAGLIQASLRRGEHQEVVSAMTEALKHRGPDDRGVWCDPTAGVSFGHRRLSVIDLSEAGRQPMISASGRYVMSYNGEVYNFQELREQLINYGHTFRGTSDTEVILAAVEQWGLDDAVSRFIGMFAFGLWDRETRTLSLVRDRLGIKPLYYGWLDGAFVFCSELRALAAVPRWSRHVRRDALAMFLRSGCVPAPWSIYEGVYKLVPGCILEVNRDSSDRADEFSPDPEDLVVPWKPRRYWRVLDVARAGCASPLACSEEESIQQLDGLLRDSVRRRMLSDVPLGAFLSGGIDSSSIVALMQAESSRPVKTFTIGFPEAAFNEAEHAKRVAAHLGTEHTELYVDPAGARNLIPELATMFDEPFADSSQIPVALLCRMTRQHVTVSLSGDGGDEVFAGYNRYVWARALWHKTGWVPRGVRRSAASLVRLCHPQTWTAMMSRVAPALPAPFKERDIGDQLYRVADALAGADEEELYLRLVSHWSETHDLVRGTHLDPSTPRRSEKSVLFDDLVDYYRYLDTVTYLPDDLLVKLDRASMAVGLEARTPLLDHRVVEFAWQLPLPLKVRAGQGKWLLRHLVARYLPPELLDRPKMGFGVPLAGWLRGPLRAWAEDLLDESRLQKQGFFNPQPIRAKWHEHLSGQRNWHFHLWDVLMFQAWLQRWGHA